MTLADLLAATRRRIGNPTLEQVPDSRLAEYLQSAYEAYNQATGAIWGTDTSLSTTAAQEYTLPASIVEVDWVELNGVMLKKQSMEEYRKRYVTWRADAAATPTEYVVYSRSLILYPKPDSGSQSKTLTIRGIVSPETIPSGGPTLIPTQDHRCLSVGAAAEYHAAAGDPQRAGALQSLFESRLKVVAQQIQRRQMAG